MAYINKTRQLLIDEYMKCLEEGYLPWLRGWTKMGQFNAATNRHYSGVNVLLLNYIAHKKGYKDPRWCTFLQAGEENEKTGKTKWKVKKGEHGVPVEYWILYKIPEWKAVSLEEKNRMIENKEARESDFTLRNKVHYVFNAEQLEGVPELELPNKEMIPSSEFIDTLIKNMGVKYIEQGDRAYYSVATDTVTIPLKQQFKNEYEYDSTRLHELCHATGHRTRLNRDLTGIFGSDIYAKEELRAEISASFLMENVDIDIKPEYITNHKAYIRSWIRQLKNDPNELFGAIYDANKIADYAAKLVKEEKTIEKKQMTTDTKLTKTQNPTVIEEDKILEKEDLNEELKDIKDALNEWAKEIYGKELDFTDLKHVVVASSKIDKIYKIQTELDFENFSFNQYIDNKLAIQKQYSNLNEMSSELLLTWDYDDLITIDKEEVKKKFFANFTLEQQNIIIDCYNKGFNIQDIANKSFSVEQMKLIQEGLNLNFDIKQFANPMYNFNQMKEIFNGLDSAVNTYYYTGKDNSGNLFNATQMKYIRESLEQGLNASYLRDTRFNEEQLKLIQTCLKEGLDVTEIANPDLNIETMHKKKEILEEKQMKEAVIERTLFNSSQLDVIDRGKEHFVNLNLLAKPDYTAEQMEVIEDAMEKRLDVGFILNPVYSPEHMTLIMDAVNYGKDIIPILSPDLNIEQLITLSDAIFDNLDVRELADKNLSEIDMQKSITKKLENRNDDFLLQQKNENNNENDIDKSEIVDERKSSTELMSYEIIDTYLRNKSDNDSKIQENINNDGELESIQITVDEKENEFSSYEEAIKSYKENIVKDYEEYVVEKEKMNSISPNNDYSFYLTETQLLYLGILNSIEIKKEDFNIDSNEEHINNDVSDNQEKEEHKKKYSSKNKIDYQQIANKIERQISITDVAREAGFSLEKNGRSSMKTREHNSLVFDLNKNTFYWNSRNPSDEQVARAKKIASKTGIYKMPTCLSGGVVSFYMEVKEKSFKEAVQDLSKLINMDIEEPVNKRKINVGSKNITEEERHKFLVQEMKKRQFTNSGEMMQVRKYLTFTRKIDPEIVELMIQRNMLYQGKDEKGYGYQAIFVGRNENGLVSSACFRSTNSNSHFKGDFSNCDYNRGWFFEPTKEIPLYWSNNLKENTPFPFDSSKRLLVFESCIEAMSYMSILKESKIDYHKFAYLSCGSISKTACVLETCKLYGYNDVVVMFNNDKDKEKNHGKERATLLAKELNQQGIKTRVLIPDKCNDWNDTLIAFKEKKIGLNRDVEKSKSNGIER